MHTGRNLKVEKESSVFSLETRNPTLCRSSKLDHQHRPVPCPCLHFRGSVGTTLGRQLRMLKTNEKCR